MYACSSQRHGKERLKSVSKPEIQPLATRVLGCCQVIVFFSFGQSIPLFRLLLVSEYIIVLAEDNPDNVPGYQSQKNLVASTV